MSYVDPNQVIANHRAAKLAEETKIQNEANNMFRKTVDYVLKDESPWGPGFNNFGGNIQKIDSTRIWIRAHKVSESVMDQAIDEALTHGWRAYKKYDNGMQHVLEITPGSLNIGDHEDGHNEIGSRNSNEHKSVREGLGLSRSSAPKTQLEVVAEKLTNLVNDIQDIRSQLEQNHGVQMDAIGGFSRDIRNQNTNLLGRLWNILVSLFEPVHHLD